MSRTVSDDAVRKQVRQRYAGIAKSGGSCCATSSCTKPDPLGNPAASAALGYSAEEMKAAPAGSNLGLGCGNPQAIAALRPGETVVDLGSGGGFDCFLAARQVGKSGRVIGVDMTPEMISKARANAAKAGFRNVEFRLGEIEHLPVADNTADAIISNCVINLSPDKPQVYRDAFRILRPGGRLAISDVVAIKPMPRRVKGDAAALCGCIAGAAAKPALERILRAAGFVDIRVRVKPESREFIKSWFPGSGAENFVASAEVTARKGTATSVNDETFDARTAELVAIGAAIAGHCQPCLTYHTAKARELGLAASEIKAAIAVGQMVERGAMAAMREFAKNADGASPQPTPACCTGTAATTGKKCCG